MEEILCFRKFRWKTYIFLTLLEDTTLFYTNSEVPKKKILFYVFLPQIFQLIHEPILFLILFILNKGWNSY